MNTRSSLQNYLLSLAAFFIVIAGLRAAKGLVVTILLAGFIGILLTPIFRFLRSRGVPTALAMLLVIGVVATIGGGVVVVVGQSANELLNRLPYYQRRLSMERDQFEKLIQEHRWLGPLSRQFDTENGEKADVAAPPDGVGSEPDLVDRLEVQQPAADAEREPREDQSLKPGLADSPLSSPARLIPAIRRESGGGESVSRLLSLEPVDGIDLMKRLLADLGSIFSSALLILITVIFILLEAARLPDKLRAAFGEFGASRDHVAEIVNNVRRYMFIKTSTSMLTGILIAAFLTVFDVRYALLWGLLAFLFNYVPNIGSIIAAGPAVALALVEGGLAQASIVALGYLVVNCLISYAIEPRFMGEGLGLSTLVVFLSLLFWGWVLGPIGMLLSAPLTMIGKIILADHEETRWIAVLLGSRAPDGSVLDD